MVTVELIIGVLDAPHAQLALGGKGSWFQT